MLQVHGWVLGMVGRTVRAMERQGSAAVTSVTICCAVLGKENRIAVDVKIGSVHALRARNDRSERKAEKLLYTGCRVCYNPVRKTKKGEDCMKLPGFLKKKEFTITEPEKWNELWDLWVKGEVDTPYAELMKYISEVFNGGHDQFFANLENTGTLQKNLAALKTILPVKHRFILWLAHKSYTAYEKKESAVSEMVTMWCDFVFDLDEAVFNEILEKYAAEKIEL